MAETATVQHEAVSILPREKGENKTMELLLAINMAAVGAFAFGSLIYEIVGTIRKARR